MNWKIIAWAIIAAMTSPAAIAETGSVNIYGVANVSFDLVDNGSTGATSGTRTNKVSSNASRIGFKGEEDLGDGLKALWQIESAISLDGASAATPDTFGTRNTYAGMNSGKLGTILLGRYDTPYKKSTRQMDMFSDSIADNRSLMGSIKGVSSFLTFDGRPTDTIAYTSPAFNGVAVSAAYVAGGEAASASVDTKGSEWSLAGWYDAAPFYGSLAYEVHDLGSAATGTLAGSGTATAYAHSDTKESAIKLGASYKQDAFTVNFAYEKTSDNLGGTGAPAFLGALATVAGANVFGHASYYLSGKYSFGSDALKVAYSHAGNLAGAASGTDTSAKQISVGYEHNLSKRTMIFALYTRLSNGANVKYALGSSGFSTGNTAAVAVGADPSAWSLGLKQTF